MNNVNTCRREGDVSDSIGAVQACPRSARAACRVSVDVRDDGETAQDSCRIHAGGISRTGGLLVCCLNSESACCACDKSALH